METTVSVSLLTFPVGPVAGLKCKMDKVSALEKLFVGIFKFSNACYIQLLIQIIVNHTSNDIFDFAIGLIVYMCYTVNNIGLLLAYNLPSQVPNANEGCRKKNHMIL